MNIKVTKQDELLTFLFQLFPNESKNNVKSFLTNDCVYVNNKKVSQYNYLLKENDNVHIITNYIKYQKNKKIEIIYEDQELLVVNKPENLLTIATQKEKEKTLYHLVSDYVKRKNKNNKIFIVHRLDKETSGIVLFAKNNHIKELLQANWNNYVLERNYIALTHNVAKKNKILKNYLKITDSGNVYITNKKEGKEAITEYKIIKTFANKSLLDIYIYTGRKNQIRLQLANDNLPIVGDKKYGIKDNEKRMYLHALKLVLIHPLTNRKLEFKTIFPFNK